MKDTFINARLIAKDLIRVSIFTSSSWEQIKPLLRVDSEKNVPLKQTRMVSMSGTILLDYHLDAPLELGHAYHLFMGSYGAVNLDVSEATTFPGFDEEYFYEGDDLGTTYSKKATKFAVWAPIASRIVLATRFSNDEPWSYKIMTRTDKGVWRATLEGNQEGLRYRYIAYNSGIRQETTDPYAKASTQNGEDSVVVDFSKYKTNFHRDALPVIEGPTESIIYELHVRDFTIDSHSNIVNKGRFLGLVEKGRKTEGGHPAGLDYLKYLGVTHVQILPMYDYKTVDETNPSTKYNWGYDPAQYFVPEGSYASKLDDPLSRIEDLKEMIASLHKEGIRVIMDVVYNHVYEYQDSVFEKIVPNYYFRRRRDGKMANTSGCGDDLATEKPMVRKLIVDACKWWIDQYGIDGFRFDLMGIVDCKTLNIIKDYAFSKDPHFILEGEGWNMGGEVAEPLGRSDNYRDIPDYGFFNDAFRNQYKDYCCGYLESMNPYKNALCGSCVDFFLAPRWDNASKSLNYVECHDNATFFDYILMKRPNLKTEEVLKIVKMGMAGVMLAHGVPFFHAGQEIGASKWKEDNTWNFGDHWNKFSYKLLDERWNYAAYFKELVELRKKYYFLMNFEPSWILENLYISDYDGIVRVDYINPFAIAPLKSFSYFVNPTDVDRVHKAEEEVEILLNQGGVLASPIKTKDVSLPGRSVVVIATK